MLPFENGQMGGKAAAFQTRHIFRTDKRTFQAGKLLQVHTQIFNISILIKRDNVKDGRPFVRPCQTSIPAQIGRGYLLIEKIVLTGFSLIFPGFWNLLEATE